MVAFNVLNQPFTIQILLRAIRTLESRVILGFFYLISWHHNLVDLFVDKTLMGLTALRVVVEEVHRNQISTMALKMLIDHVLHHEQVFLNPIILVEGLRTSGASADVLQALLAEVMPASCYLKRFDKEIGANWALVFLRGLFLRNYLIVLHLVSVKKILLILI